MKNELASTLGSSVFQSDVNLLIQKEIAEIDFLLNQLVNAVIHHPSFQRLEASWRGLFYLVTEASGVELLKIRLLDVNWKLISNDLKQAFEFDQSQLFKKIYTNEFDQPGGEPFGLLIGDYYVSHHPHESAGQMETLSLISSVAAAAFAPFVTAANASFFDLDSFAGLHASLNLERSFKQNTYIQWKKLRESEDSRFLGITLPRVLMRLPYSINDANRVDEFCFQEVVDTTEDYLWGNPAYCFASIAVRSFNDTGLFTEIRGTEKGVINKGLVTGLPRVSNYASATEASITSKQEKELSQLGFIALSQCQYTEFSAFYSCRSVQQPQVYDKEIASINAEMSSMLHYMLCVSRFAHYIKIIVRNKLGTFKNVTECETFLQNWLMSYTAITDSMSAASKAKYPLREAKVKVYEHTKKPGSFYSVIQLRPHYQSDRLDATMTLSTELSIKGVE